MDKKIYHSCGNCKHWEATGMHGKIGECHFNPPTPLLNMDGDIIYVFPETLAAHKCGQWLPLAPNFSEVKSKEGELAT
jgi:hypothetical protein